MTDKYHSDTQEKIETITYFPDLQDSGDLETSTKTILATVEATGIGNADYSKALTLPSPADARLEVLRIATRLSVTIDSDDGIHDLRCRVYVDAQDASHMLFDLTYSSTGNQLAVQDCLVGTKEFLFNLLKDGSAHTFYFFFWSPGNHSPVISVVQLWEAVGKSGMGSWDLTNRVIRINHSGFVQISFITAAIGTQATPLVAAWYQPGTNIWSAYIWRGLSNDAPASYSVNPLNFLMQTGTFLHMGGAAVTDLSYLRLISITARSEG